MISRATSGPTATSGAASVWRWRCTRCSSPLRSSPVVFSLFFFAVSQLVYELPARAIALVRHRNNLAIGILIGATLSFFVAFGTCAAWFMGYRY